jgi:hypothetical protein
MVRDMNETLAMILLAMIGLAIVVMVDLLDALDYVALMNDPLVRRPILPEGPIKGLEDEGGT